ncbi:RNA-guided endonuclease InsQ/TnpB family protein [Streptomyces violaceusniger]|uniref:RNA-guided endonuclease InsQ/TnpB family protein n=1 Tax=Streptomyces violaceusniger TaxID=68280 RepID=UPI003811B7F5
MAAQEVLRAYRFALDPTDAQLESLARYAGAARWAFNHALAVKQTAHHLWRTEVAALTKSGVAEPEARKRIKISVPSKPAIQKAWVAERGDSRHDADGSCPWWWEVNNYCFQSGFVDADTAWRNWLSSLRGDRAGRRVGYPRFKKKGRCRDSFRLHHDVKRPTIRLVGYRRLNLPKLGEVRIHDSGKRLAGLVAGGRAVIQSVTVSRGGSRWYASVLCKVQQEVPEKPTARQRVGGLVGVDLGSAYLAVLSDRLRRDDPDSIVVEHPRHLKKSLGRLVKAQRALARTVNGSARRAKAARRVARIHHQVAERRATDVHALTKRLTCSFAHVVVENLDIKGMVARAERADRTPGASRRGGKIAAMFNRHLMDASLGEVRRQLSYKAPWYGAVFVTLAQGEPVNQVCSRCGTQNSRVTPADSKFTCADCGLVIGRQHNAARNIVRAGRRRLADVPSGSGETENARGASVRPHTRKGAGRGALKREDTGRQPPGATPRE